MSCILEDIHAMHLHRIPARDLLLPSRQAEADAL
jgi:hypothetical protein